MRVRVGAVQSPEAHVTLSRAAANREIERDRPILLPDVIVMPEQDAHETGHAHRERADTRRVRCRIEVVAAREPFQGGAGR